ncbi:DUF2517 family protein [Corallincola platygyrae]|uniref:DUF2517 family protein n=1 Tax=Corallincola platygyrae TaxID=1193278 RepID=A0ABW4XKL2_9GAMM
MYSPYSTYKVVARRVTALLLGFIAFPFVFTTKRAQLFSYLHRMWLKTSDKPVWMAQSQSVFRKIY